MKLLYTKAVVALFILSMITAAHSYAQTPSPKFRVIAITEHRGLHHQPFVDTAKLWLDQLAKDSGFVVDYIENTAKINEAFLTQYKAFIQLNYPPYMWTDTAAAAFEKFIMKGKGMGWIGFHHATLLGEFDGYPMWNWFSKFMGDIRFKNYIASFSTATVKVEDTAHPCMRGVSPDFVIENEEWYTYNKNPRPNVHVLASVDESSYKPDSELKMGDHPVVWTNEQMKARNIYIFMGHHAELFNNENFKKLFRNAIFWAAGR